MNNLVELYAEMAAITSPVCKSECREDRNKKYRCCDYRYCIKAKEFASTKYGIELEITGNKDLPYMGENGCTVPPHFRPICTLHACPISYAAISMLGNDKGKTRKYFELRKHILEQSIIQGKEINW